MNEKRIQILLACPEMVRELPSPEDWASVECKWCRLPADFKAFVSDYGTGCIDNFVWVFNPASQNENLNLSQQITQQLTAFKGTETLGLSLFPTKEGILPFGMTDNGDLLAWKVTGQADAWPVVIIDSRVPDYQEFEMGFSDFMYVILTKEVVCRIFPTDFPSDHPAFVPVVV
ncbi:MAG: SMI1/KNR4 family protein [Planctomycetes bacterium]|nr:SMI1/KNR4 family protein [Planctomycetota bacterium]